MQIQQKTKLFAFKLADKKASEAKPAAQWKVREGVSVAGCSLLDEESAIFRTAPRFGIDTEIYC